LENSVILSGLFQLQEKVNSHYNMSKSVPIIDDKP